MIRKSVVISLIVVMNMVWLPAQDIRVGLYYEDLVMAFTFHCTAGEYDVKAGGSSRLVIHPGDILYVSLINDSIYVNDGELNYGPYEGLTFKDTLLKGRCRIKPVQPSLEAHDYAGDVDVGVSHNTLSLVNQIDFDRYLAGVVETEAGPVAPEEFYKAQAVLCRTYALRNWNRHQGEGFNLCDHTHCQAYKGLSEQSPVIYTAVLATHNVVVADRHYQLIMAAYHSNSGGETEQAADIWPVDLDYLQAIIDPFSKNQKHYQWRKKLSPQAWFAYLETKGIDVADADTTDLLIKQPHRKKTFIYGKDTLSMSVIREDLGLKSAFFDMTLAGDSLVISGRGYGHGVGLSQEGAMEMAREGYSYSDILRFYFNDISISDVNELPDSELPEAFR
ncbi:MAG TPA: SpoIID/LytB domain-containing protein [Bacteroidales bacterium]|nr:SpoIID/LytB domain-containing protein [Bacteroidales bacterium]